MKSDERNDPFPVLHEVYHIKKKPKFQVNLRILR
jgi:hypothetical protein